MQAIRNSARGLSLLLDLNWDLLMALGALTLALALGAWMVGDFGSAPIQTTI